jgi:hypothetical protein
MKTTPSGILILFATHRKEKLVLFPKSKPGNFNECVICKISLLLYHRQAETNAEENPCQVSRAAVANRWSVEKFGHYLQFLCFIMLFYFKQATINITNNFVIIKQVHFILIKWNFYDYYFIDVCTFLKNIHVSGPRD